MFFLKPKEDEEKKRTEIMKKLYSKLIVMATAVGSLKFVSLLVDYYSNESTKNN